MPPYVSVETLLGGRDSAEQQHVTTRNWSIDCMCVVFAALMFIKEEPQGQS